MRTILYINELIPEFAAHAYFRWMLNRWEISFYRERSGLFQFVIDLPFFHLTNNLYRDTILLTTYTASDPQNRIVAKVSGKIFWHKITPAKVSDSKKIQRDYTK